MSVVEMKRVYSRRPFINMLLFDVCYNNMVRNVITDIRLKALVLNLWVVAPLKIL